jgi:hypothetical protein
MGVIFSRVTIYRSLAALVLSSVVAVAHADLVATQIDKHNLDQRVGGIDAIGGMGDWLLSNGTLCATISDAGHETGLSLSGGWLVDLGHCGRNDDQLGYTHLLPMMDREAILPVTDIATAVTDGIASITVVRENAALRARIRYSLSLEQARELRVDSELWRIGDGHGVSMVGQIWLHPGRSLTPFTVSTHDRDYSPGYQYIAFEEDSDASSLNSMVPADLTVLIGGDAAGPGISYGIQSLGGVLQDAHGKQHPLLQFSLVETDYTNQAWLTRPLWFGSGAGVPGRLQMLQSLFMDIEPGETLQLHQRILVSEHADAASITDLVYKGHWLIGKLDTAAAQLQVYDARGNPVTAARPQSDGSFRMRMPVGVDSGELEVVSAFGKTSRIELVFAGADLQLPAINTAAPATVLLPKGTTMRLVFTGRGETPDPAFGNDFSNFHLGSRAEPLSIQSNSIDLVGDQRDPVSVLVPEGDYRVYASRGPEYSVSSQDIRAASGQQLRLTMQAPRRVVDSSGWVSTDFHVHSGLSFDSAISAEQRLRSFLAQDAAVLVATEHDRIVDLAGHARELGYQRRLTVVGGAELTGMVRTGEAPYTFGHVNVFPLSYDASAFAGGMPAHEGLRLRQVMAQVRRQHPEALIQLNHPRAIHGPDTSPFLFEHLSVGEHFNPGLPLENIQNRALIEADEQGVRDIDFDLLEMANGSNLGRYQRIRADWLSLILQGEYRPALASSDSHHLRQPVAMPRSYVAYGGEHAHPIAIDPWRAAVRAGRIVGSSGPLPALSLSTDTGLDAGIGETIVGRNLVLSLSVQAAPWVDVSQAWVYLNGVVIRGGPIEPGEQWEMPIEVERDSFVFVEIYGDAGEIYAALAPGHRPMAFTNPIWIDADGDGAWTAPGLNRLPIAISSPASFPNERPE